MPDSMQQNFAVVAADGSVTFQFQGTIIAQGLQLDLNTGGALNPINSIVWRRPSDLLTGAVVRGYDDGTGDGVLQIEGDDPDSNGADFAALRCFGINALNSSKIEVLLAGNNGNQQSGVRRLLQLANGAGGSPPYVSDWLLCSPQVASSGLIRCFRVLANAFTYSAADANGRLYTPAIGSAYDPTLVFSTTAFFLAPYDCVAHLIWNLGNFSAAAGTSVMISQLLNSGVQQDVVTEGGLGKGAAPAVSGIDVNEVINVANGSDLRLFSYSTNAGTANLTLMGFILPNRGQIP